MITWRVSCHSPGNVPAVEAFGACNDNRTIGDRPEWCLLKQFHKYMKYNWPRKHTEKHGKNDCLTGNGSVSFRVFPWQGS